jgi:hypothetical protein
LTEIAIALANGQPAPRETLRRLETAAKEIEVIKNQIRASAVDAANEALDRLERDDPAQYAKLVRDRRSDTLS